MARRRDADEEEQLTGQLNVRVTDDDLERLAVIAGLVPRSIVARVALRLGMEQLEKRPALLESRAKAARRGPKPGSKRKPKPD